METMETDDIELDVEGIDDDGPSSSGLGMDPNELPSVSSHLSPELSQHPWLTFDEQFNSHIPSVILHDDMDESSRATINQMIFEEHSYLHRKKFMRRKNKGLKTLFTAKRERKLPYTRWTQEEKDLFKKGMDEHGHKWKEIADMIKTRNRVQVKNYARNYLQNQANDGQDFSSKCSVKAPDSQLSETLEEDENTLPLLRSLDDNDEEEDHVTEGDQRMGSLDEEEVEEENVSKRDQHFLSVDDDDEDVDIDVEETSDSEQRDQGLQSTLLFGDILRHSVHPSSDDDKQNEGSILPGNSEQDGENTEQTSRMSRNIKLEDPSQSHSGTNVKSEIEAEDIDVNVSSCAVALMGSKISLKTNHHHSSEEDEGLTICLPGERRNNRTKRRGKGSRKRMLEETITDNKSSTLTEEPVSDSLETTPESSLPGNLKSGRKQTMKQKMKELVEHRWKKRLREPVRVKKEEALHLEIKQEKPDHPAEGYMEVVVKKEKDISDYKEDLGTSGMESVFVRSKDYSELCLNSLCENSVVKEIKSEPDFAASADNQHALDIESKEQEKRIFKSEGDASAIDDNQHASLDKPSRQQDKISDCASDQSLEGSHNEKRKFTLHPDDKDQVSSDILTISTKEGLPMSDECRATVSDNDYDRDKKCTKKHKQDDEEEKDDEPSNHPRPPAGEDKSNDDEDDDDEEEENNRESDEETMEPPKEEITLDPGHVTDGEKEAHPMYFDYHSSAKTPERYLAIRNHIVKSWLKMKPSYLNKTAARNGLRSGGDVNLIGQIHEYLEGIGAINFGAYNQFQQKCKKRQSTKKRLSHLFESEFKTNRLESMRPRRKIKKKMLEDDEKPSLAIEKQKKPRSRQPIAQAYDPFKLIDCHKFSSTLPAPFSVKLKGDAIVTMDVHSHLSTTEVIGLLGGVFDPEQSVLDVRLARPCRSLSTGMQCEMDPVSQTEACEDIQSVGCRVVGWYHSHPTFSPNPSIRDIETQGHFQEWFSQDTKTPFIGVIVSPYHSRQLLTSKINCLTVSQEWSQDLQCWRPYTFDFSVYQDKDEDLSHHHLLSTASQLISQFAQYKYRVEMLWVCPGQSGITYLGKMLQSISTNLCGNEETKSDILSKLKSMVYDLFGNHCSNIIKDSAVDVTLPFDSSP